MNQEELSTKDMENKVELDATTEASCTDANEADTTTNKPDNNYVPPLQNQFWPTLIVFIIVLIFILLGGSNLFK